MNILVQQEQLHVNLHNIGLQGASLTEVQLHLRRRYPDKCDKFLRFSRIQPELGRRRCSVYARADRTGAGYFIAQRCKGTKAWARDSIKGMGHFRSA
jgi:hypothetical protein